VLYLCQGWLMPYVHAGWVVRIVSMGALVSAGALVYALAAILLGAFSRDDLQLLLRRRTSPTKPN
jgi:putative peptidoglycan lipid II flippase